VVLLPALDNLVVVTEERRKSPFLEELECAYPLGEINWADYPPVRGTTTRLVVKIGNQDRRGGAPTFAIKDLLKASGYQWQLSGWPGWVKSFPAQDFEIETLKSEVWAEPADGIDIRIFDDTETLVARFLINMGKWDCDIDDLKSFCVTSNTNENETFVGPEPTEL